MRLTGKETFTLTASLDAVDSRNALLGAVLSSERTRALRGAAAYARSFAKGEASASAALTLSQGIDGLGARTVARGYSEPDFRKATVLVAAQRAYGKWTVRLRASGQAAAGPLPSSEQMSLGGDDIGRAFSSGVATGDEGAGGSVELAYSPKLGPPILKSLEAYVFTDARAHPHLLPACAGPAGADGRAGVGRRGRAGHRVRAHGPAGGGRPRARGAHALREGRGLAADRRPAQQLLTCVQRFGLAAVALGGAVTALGAARGAGGGPDTFTLAISASAHSPWALAVK